MERHHPRRWLAAFGLCACLAGPSLAEPAIEVFTTAGEPAAQRWVADFVQWYNLEHRHSAIRFVTPAERHNGQDVAVLAKRDAIYAEAKRKHPGRWSGSTRNWTPRKTAWLNPDLDDPVYQRDQRLEAA